MSGNYRHEYKYLVSDKERTIIESQIKYILQKDKHVNSNGEYNIKSLYFDDYYDSCLYDNINGTNPREKFRIRIYNNDISRITLECKRKENGKTKKESEIITENQCRNIINNNYLKNIEEQGPLLRKLTELMMSNRLKPVIIVQYDRIPYTYKYGNVRVTFDKNLCSSTKIEKFLSDVYYRRPVMPIDINLMEVKWDDYIPDVVYNSLSISNLQQTTYSKYYLCRKYS